MNKIRQPVFKSQVDFKVDTEVFTEKATIVHCKLSRAMHMRIWPTTYLIQEDGTRKSLVQAYNIPAYPQWKWVPCGSVFTLVFEGLDKGCQQFELLEDIPEPGEFHVCGIRRNEQDVYRIEI